MKVSCLMATHGRVPQVREAVACFMLQTYTNRELVILNNHPEPIHLSDRLRACVDLGLIRIYNEPKYPTLGHCRNRLLDLATGDAVRTWDDDDFYLPWTIAQGVAGLAESGRCAWKPRRSWFHHGTENKYELQENTFEAAMLVYRHVAAKYRYRESGGDEHLPLLQGIHEEGGCATPEVGPAASYVYRWGCGNWHISGTLGTGTVAGRTAEWMERNNCIGDGVIDIAGHVNDSITDFMSRLVRNAKISEVDRNTLGVLLRTWLPLPEVQRGSF